MAAIFTGKPGAVLAANAYETDRHQEIQGSLTTPPGLRNIGNTCYLNSLLQYFYNVNPIRDAVINYSELKMDLDEATVATRRTGGSGMPVEMEEAIVARQFTEMLQTLFLNLQTTQDTAAEPSQKLANTALSSARTLLTEKSPEGPPPLPARPSPAPPMPPQKSEDVDMVNVTVEAVHDGVETASAVSSQTLINEGEGVSAEPFVAVNMVDGEAQVKDIELEDSGRKATSTEDAADVHTEPQALTLEERIQEVSQRLEHSDRKGTDQQDVEEVIGFILEHLMRAVRPSGSLGGIDGLQADIITDTFFPVVVNYTQKVDADESTANREIVADRFITAFPHPTPGNPRPLIQALDEHFDVQFMDGGFARYTTIRSLPPIVHIRIQRTGRSKNMNPVILEDVLYLDRYMEAAPHSELDVTRRRAWANKELVNELTLRKSEDPKLSVKPRPSTLPTGDAQPHQNAEGRNHTTSTEQGDPTLLAEEEPMNVGGDLPEDQEEFDPLLADWTIVTNAASGLKAQPSAPTASYGPTAPFAGAGKPVNDVEPIDKQLIRTADFGRILSDITANFVSESAQDYKELKSVEEETFSKFRKHKYRLHAVICHSGGSSAGHYWIWVHDFKKNVWLKYNDSMVTEDARDSQAVLDQLSQNGDPYYLAYVRDELKEELVSVPERAERIAQSEPMQVETIEGIDPSERDKHPTDPQLMDVDEAPPYETL
jgi:ubiquitin carboxyl-terminal hydrolase 25